MFRFCQLFLVLLCVSSCHTGESTFSDTYEPSFSSGEDIETTFLGTSSFLIRSGDTTLVVDGYFTRTKLNLLGGIQPDRERVSAMLCDLGLALVDHRYVPSTHLPDCLKHTERLDAIIVTHGHFDHALDAPLIAALTGAKIVGDRATALIMRATRDAFDLPKELWDQVEFVDVTVCTTNPSGDVCEDGRPLEGREQQIIRFEDITVTLFETPHSTNVGSRFIDRGQAKAFEFRTSIFSMKQVVSLSIHIRAGEREILIVPTAGDLNGRVSRLGLQADIVFLGVGGLSIQGPGTSQEFFETALHEISPERIFPIHWDNFTRPIDISCPKLYSALFDDIDKLELQLKALSKEGRRFEVVRPPVSVPFDPFSREFQNLEEVDGRACE